MNKLVADLGFLFLLLGFAGKGGGLATVVAAAVVVPAWLVAPRQLQAQRSLPRGLYSRSTVKS